MATPRSRIRRRILIGVVVVAIFALLALARFYTDVLWFQEVGFVDVLWTSLAAEAAVGLAVGSSVAILVWVNLFVASRTAPRYAPVSVGGRVDPIERYREVLGPYVVWLRVAVAAAVGLLTGLAASGAWQTVVLWVNRVDFGAVDPEFGRDIGFYVFELPFLNHVLGWLWFALLASIVLSIGAHIFLGSIRPDRGLAGVAPAALAHISVLLGLVALVKAGQYWLGRFELNFSERGTVTGASYTDVHAQEPALMVLTVISVISAVLFLVNIRVRRVALPIAAVGIWILIAFLAGGVWPWWVQRFSVEPQELERERVFIQRNLDATRGAFGLDDVSTEPFAASGELDASGIETNQPLLQNVRLWDPEVLSQAYDQLQAIRTYYDFPDVDIDRYEVNGEQRQVLLSARELELDDLAEGSRTWSNEHLQYTHGFGIVASLANEKTAAGQPSFLVRDVPGTVVPGAEDLEVEQPRLYYGEGFEDHEYSVVNSEQSELDYATEEGVERSQYAGEGGVSLGGFFNRFAFAVRESDPNLVLSDLITDDSRILLYRNVRERVRRVAPFLGLDHDPYIAVVDGRATWIIDAYTTTEWYPYAQRFDLDEIVSGGESGTVTGEANYIRNSVKITIDAYDGEMKLYVVDESDPLIQAWRGAFPDLFTDETPSEDLQAHFRYPEDLFKIQSEVYLSYHMTDPAEFYAKEDQWELPENPRPDETTEGDDTIPPRYLLTQLPDETDQEFLLIRPFTPRAKDNMIALLVARSDPENYGELLTLQLPRQRQILGPIQVDALINQDVDISRTLTLLGQEGSDVTYGALVILPIEDSILYVQPLFVTAEQVGIPELKRVVVVSGQEVAMEETFEEALASVFGIEEEPPPPVEPPGEGEGPEGPGEGEPAIPGDLEQVIGDAGRLYRRAQEALAEGDFETYGRLIERLGKLIERAEELSGGQAP